MITDTELLELLKKTGALLEGHFLLTSGRHSDRYIEKFRILEDPVALDRVCEAMAAGFKDRDVELVLGAAVGGILLAGGVGRHLGVRHIFTERVDGKMTFRRGFEITPGTRIAIVEDIITTGGSVHELIKLARERKAEITGWICLVNRNSSLPDFGVPARALLSLPAESWEPEDCPLCRNDIPITARGRSGRQATN